MYIEKRILFYILTLFDVQVKLREMKPGMLSHELKEALGMPDGAPPPWLINMQVILEYLVMCLLYYSVLGPLTTLNVFSEIWSPTIIPSSKDPWTECSHPPWS